jgi:hypothetical protein
MYDCAAIGHVVLPIGELSFWPLLEQYHRWRENCFGETFGKITSHDNKMWNMKNTFFSFSSFLFFSLVPLSARRGSVQMYLSLSQDSVPPCTAPCLGNLKTRWPQRHGRRAPPTSPQLHTTSRWLATPAPARLPPQPHAIPRIRDSTTADYARSGPFVLATGVYACRALLARPVHPYGGAGRS